LVQHHTLPGPAAVLNRIGGYALTAFTGNDLGHRPASGSSGGLGESRLLQLARFFLHDR
jgi:hypothetical protein